MKCTKCGKEILQGSGYCTYCGEIISPEAYEETGFVCPVCQKPVEEGDASCKWCGVLFETGDETDEVQETEATDEVVQNDTKAETSDIKEIKKADDLQELIADHQEKKSKDKKALIVVVVIIIAALAVVGIFFGVKRSQGAEEHVVENPIVESQGTYYVTGSENGLLVYEDATMEGEVLAMLNNKDAVDLVEETEEGIWQIHEPESKVLGYVDSHYLIDDEQAVVDPIPVYVNVDEDAELKITSEMDDAGETVATLMRGDTIILLADPQGDSYYVWVPDEAAFGYAPEKSISLSEVQDKNKDQEDQKDDSEASDVEQPDGTAAGGDGAKADDTKGDTAATDNAKGDTTVDNGGSKADVGEKEDPNRVFGVNVSPKSYKALYYVRKSDGDLPLRNSQKTDSSNEIAQIPYGYQLDVIDMTGNYWYVYVPSLGAYGYVDKAYISTKAPIAPPGPAVPESSSNSNTNNTTASNNTNTSSNAGSGTTYTCSGMTNYLALRSAPAYAEENEIGALGEGEQVQVLNASGTYWYVRTSSGAEGYVNSRFLK